MQDNYDDINAVDYLKDNFSNVDIFGNEKIIKMIELNHVMNFNMDMDSNIEYIKDKYTKLYSYLDIFKNDKNNINNERLSEIIYNNINKKYNYDIIYDEPEKIIQILEKE